VSLELEKNAFAAQANASGKSTDFCIVELECVMLTRWTTGLIAALLMAGAMLGQAAPDSHAAATVPAQLVYSSLVRCKDACSSSTCKLELFDLLEKAHLWRAFEL
jgi:hypothetical protein